MADDIRAFEANVEGFMKTLVPREVNAYKAKIALDVLDGVVKMTPVDTGRARANWQVSLARPADGVVDDADKKPLGSKPGSAFWQRAVAEAENVIIGEDIWVVNNLPYIQVLEEGHSKQAGSGMVAVTMANLNTQFS